MNALLPDGRGRTKQTEGIARLSVSFALNIGLWFAYSGMAKWSTVEREFRLLLLGGCLAIVALVVVVPVFWKGVAWQAPVALLLMALPGFAIVSVFSHLAGWD